jgi:hypothetical protein
MASCVILFPNLHAKISFSCSTGCRALLCFACAAFTLLCISDLERDLLHPTCLLRYHVNYMLLCYLRQSRRRRKTRYILSKASCVRCITRSSSSGKASVSLSACYPEVASNQSQLPLGILYAVMDMVVLPRDE